MIDFSKVKAVMFDFDGTITPRGQHYPNSEMIDLIIEVGKRMPFSFCTGRDISSFRKHAYELILERVLPEDKDVVLSNLFYIGENGAIGYQFCPLKKDLQSFYRVEWPEDFFPRKALMDNLDEVCSEFGSVLYDAHKIVVVVRTNVVKELTEMSGNVDKMYEFSAKLENICREYLNMLNADYDNFVQIGNAGLGVVISPAGGNKNRGIKEFKKYLEENRGYKFGEKAREIVVIGDRPEVGGNDHYFLNGELGSAFSVGHEVEDVKYPMSIRQADGRRMMHDDGTREILKQILKAQK